MRLTIFLFFFLLTFPFLSVRAEVSFFWRNLSLGVSGDDVLLLQKILNARAETRVSSFGVGSPGNESLFFGLKTKNAVARLQALYPKEILLPAGLSSGNGFVGSLTRAVLEDLVASIVPSSDTPSGNISSNAPTNSPSLSSSIYNISPLSGPDGTIVTLSGDNFALTNNIYTSYGIHHDISSSDGKTLRFTITSPVPEAERKYVPPLAIKVYIVNVYGKSGPIDFIITN